MLKGTHASLNNYLIKQLPKATVFINMGFELVHVSDRWISDFGFEPGNVLGKSLYELFGRLDQGLVEVLETSLRGKGGGTFVQCLSEKNNHKQWFEWTAIPWYDDKENIIGSIVQSEDISRQVNERSKLERLQILLQDKTEISKIGSWEYNAGTEELSWCSMTRRIHEVPEDYIPNLDDAINFYVEGYNRNTISMAVFHAMEHGTSWSEKLQLTTYEGNELWVIAAGKPIFKDGIFQGLVGTFQDISDHVRSEMKIRESEHLLRTVVDNLPLNVYIKDLECRKILVNKSECDYLGFEDPSQLIGKTDFELYDKEIAQISYEEDLSVLNYRTPILGKEALSVTKEGKTTTFLSSKIPLIDPDGNTFGLLGLSMDISNLKKQESELRNLINVTSLQNKKLISFAHIVSHNLRSHTANFSMLLDFLSHETDEEEKKKILEMLNLASDNLLETLENLNEVVSINSNVGQQKKRVGLNQAIKSVCQNLSPFLRNHNAQIINKVPKDTRVNVVAAYLDSILMNFITNAVKYRHPQRPPVISLSAKKLENYTVLSIADNGLGIDLKKHGDKLFGMYKTFHENSEARGIGLYITKNQIEAMEGKVTTKSTVGKGTTFNIYFNEKN